MTKATEKAEMSDATAMSGCRAITLPVELLQDGRLTTELIGALALGLAHQNDPRPLPQLLQEVGGMRKTTARRVTDELLRRGYAARAQKRGQNGRGFGPMCYRFSVDPQLSG